MPAWASRDGASTFARSTTSTGGRHYPFGSAWQPQEDDDGGGLSRAGAPPGEPNDGWRSRPGGGISEGRESLEVAQRLAALDPPFPLATDRGAEADLEHRVEVVVGVAQDRPEDPVDLLRRDRGMRQAAAQIDVAHRVDRVRDAVHPRVVLQQEGPQLLAVLVGLAAHERLHPQRVVADDQPAHGLQLLGPGQVDQPPSRRGVLVRQVALAEGLIDDGVELGERLLPVYLLPVHRATCTPGTARSGPRPRSRDSGSAVAIS